MLSQLHQNWLEKRGINLDAVIHMGIYSGKRGPDGQVVSDHSGDILCIPYTKDGKIVGHKYRGPNKKFWQQENGRKQFYNVDVLEDPALHDGDEALVIVEGEMDALAVLSVGYPWVVSVPDGAPPAKLGESDEAYSPEREDDVYPLGDTKYSYLMADWANLSRVRKIIIAADSDAAGQRLASELVRRLDRVRCSFIVYPETCKDLNEVLVQEGKQAVLEVIRSAKPYPVEGIYRLSDFPEEDRIETVATGWAGLHDILRPYLGAFMVVGGFPGHGKSTWTMQLAANLAKMHRWPVALASFEMRIVPYVTDALMAVYLDNDIKFAHAESKAKAKRFIESMFTFVAPNRSDTETEHDIDWLIDKLQTAVIRNGVKMVLIDPFNEIEHRKRSDESLTEYIGRAIRKLKSFAMQYNVLVCVVVHPTKAVSQMDSSELSLYSLADSSHWANKADIGVIVGRVGDPQVESLTGIYIKKIRYQPDAGVLGEAFLTFDRGTRLFYG